MVLAGFPFGAHVTVMEVIPTKLHVEATVIGGFASVAVEIRELSQALVEPLTTEATRP
jgi:hypothetical protein